MARAQRNVLALQRWVTHVLVVTGLLLTYAIFIGDRGVRHYQTLHHTLVTRMSEADQRLSRNRRLLKRLEQLRHDPRALEELARTKLGVVGKNELVYVFPTEP